MIKSKEIDFIKLSKSYETEEICCFTLNGNVFSELTQPAIACSKLTIETLEQGVKYVQS